MVTFKYYDTAAEGNHTIGVQGPNCEFSFFFSFTLFAKQENITFRMGILIFSFFP